MGSVKKKNVNLFGKKGKKMQKLKNHGTQTGISDASKKKKLASVRGIANCTRKEFTHKTLHIL
jgi:hypothetical protein